MNRIDRAVFNRTPDRFQLASASSRAGGKSGRLKSPARRQSQTSPQSVALTLMPAPAVEVATPVTGTARGNDRSAGAGTGCGAPG